MDTNEHEIFYSCLLVSIRVQVVKARINKGFLGTVDGHCQWDCQQSDGLKHNPPLSGQHPLKLAHYTLTCRDGLVA
jgi:hypothetical protein